MSRYALVRDGQVVNVALWDGKTEWTPDEGCTVHKLADDSQVGPGWTRFTNGRYKAPEPTDPEPLQVGLVVDSGALAVFFQTVQDPNSDPRDAIAALAEALNTAPADSA